MHWKVTEEKVAGFTKIGMARFILPKVKHQVELFSRLIHLQSLKSSRGLNKS